MIANSAASLAAQRAAARSTTSRRQAPVVEPTLNLEIRQRALHNWNVLLGERTQHDLLVGKWRIRGAQCRHDYSACARGVKHIAIDQRRDAEHNAACAAASSLSQETCVASMLTMMSAARRPSRVTQTTLR